MADQPQPTATKETVENTTGPRGRIQISLTNTGDFNVK